MRRTAAEHIRSLEMRVARLERMAATIDLFKTYKRLAVEALNKIQNSETLPLGLFPSKPEKKRNRSRGATATFGGYIGPVGEGAVWMDADVDYTIEFLKDSEFKSPLEYGLKHLYEQSSFNFYLDGKLVATAKNGKVDSSFLSKVARAIRRHYR